MLSPSHFQKRVRNEVIITNYVCVCVFQSIWRWRDLPQTALSIDEGSLNRHQIQLLQNEMINVQRNYHLFKMVEDKLSYLLSTTTSDDSRNCIKLLNEPTYTRRKNHLNLLCHSGTAQEVPQPVQHQFLSAVVFTWTKTILNMMKSLNPSLQLSSP